MSHQKSIPNTPSPTVHDSFHVAPRNWQFVDFAEAPAAGSAPCAPAPPEVPLSPGRPRPRRGTHSFPRASSAERPCRPKQQHQWEILKSTNWKKVTIDRLRLCSRNEIKRVNYIKMNASFISSIYDYPIRMRHLVTQ